LWARCRCNHFSKHTHQGCVCNGYDVTNVDYKRGNILTTELLPPSIGTGGPLNRDRLPDTRPRKRAPADVAVRAPTHGGTTSDTAQGGFTMTFADTGCTASCTQHPGLLEPHPLFPWGARPPEIPMPPLGAPPPPPPERGEEGFEITIIARMITLITRSC
jgi:hypothetical protein